MTILFPKLPKKLLCLLFFEPYKLNLLGLNNNIKVLKYRGEVKLFINKQLLIRLNISCLVD